MKKVVTKTIIFIAYFLAIFFLRKVGSFAFTASFLTIFTFDLILWLVSAILGAHLIKLDQLFYVYFTKPNDPLSLQIKKLISEKKAGKVWDVLEEKILEQKQLASRGILFQTVWAVLAFFVIFSYPGLFGKSLVLGVGFKLLLEEWDSYLNSGNFNWVFWQIKREVGVGEQKIFLYIMTGIFTILTLLII